MTYTGDLLDEIDGFVVIDVAVAVELVGLVVEREDKGNNGGVERGNGTVEFESACRDDDEGLKVSVVRRSEWTRSTKRSW